MIESARAGKSRGYLANRSGFSSGADELYEFYKDHIGPFHWTPREMSSLTFPDVSGVSPKDLAVICWILPQT